MKIDFLDDCDSATEAHFMQGDMFSTIGKIKSRAYGDYSLSCISTFIRLPFCSRWVL